MTNTKGEPFFVSRSDDGGSDGSESEAEEKNTSKNLLSDSEEENQSGEDRDQCEEDEDGDQSEEEDGGKQDVILKENG